MRHTLRLFLIGFCFIASAVLAGNGAALHEAAKKGDRAQVKALLARGADVNARDMDGYSPLQRALHGDKKMWWKCLLLMAPVWTPLSLRG